MFKHFIRLISILLLSLSACTAVQPLVDTRYEGDHPLLQIHSYRLAALPEYVNETDVFRIDHIYDLAILAYVKHNYALSSFYFMMEDNPDINFLFALLESLIPYSFELTLSTLTYESNAQEGIQIYQLSLKPSLEEVVRLPQILETFSQAYRLNTLSLEDQLRTIHDQLILSTQYDMSILDLDLSIPQKHPSFEAIGLFENHTAVCSGYARAFNGLAHQLNIPSLIISSEVMAHAWNMVYLEGEWLYVDVTFDDPVPDQKDKVRSTYYLLDETDLLSLGKHEFDVKEKTALDAQTYLEFANYVYFNVKTQ